MNHTPPKQPIELPRRRTLSALGRERGLSSSELAAILARSRPQGVHLAALQEAIAAMGGRLELVARFPDAVVKITDQVRTDVPY